ncbi:uncharacterized protein K444DRAFT_141877 [Hyaloscypha bicolor E]|uniref:C6 zinc finger domain protein n=1 Tax=Hyaloscypha bicolor E TaxID=1095630 RepID=A0A2J6SS55_9HELO|nr:uncharacterized protein K444DRAFT_141877 [Hyaloscypha bicolor E]PMD53606.1 hypothetical protein K444DRAFT_141877 [Hyaloscypha bicolor E]
MMSPWSDSQVALAPTLGLSANEQSNRFFHSFLHDCVPVLTETMDSEFWQRGILRASSSPAVQHAAIAFGAVYEQRVANDGRLASSPNDKRLGVLSSLCYANAIRILRHCVAESSQAPEKLEEIMITCLIFIFMEILRGDDIAAVTHLDGALKIYSCGPPPGQALFHLKENKVTSEMDTTLEKLTNAFLRLDIQSVQYMGSRTPWEPDRASLWFQTREDIPATFETLLGARDSLYAQLANIMNFVTPLEGAEKCFPAWSPHPDRGFDIYTVFHGSTYRDYDLPKAATKRRHFMYILSRWKSAFQGFLQKGTVKTPEALAGCALLLLAYYTTRINLAVSYTTDECCYDEQLSSFKKIMEQVKVHLKYTTHASPSQLPRDPNGNLPYNMPRLKPRKNHFKVHSTLCYPLYYTALECRYKPLRQSALALLRNADSEGIWDADMLARIAEFVIDVEEHLEPDSRNVSADSPSFGVPETNRIHCLSLNVDKDRGIVWLRYNRRTMETQGEISDSSDPLKRWRINSTTLAWKDSTAVSVEIVDPE